MFDVPVLEVTVPLSSTLAGEVSQNKYLVTPHIPSALLNAIVPASTQLSADVIDESAGSIESEIKALLPQAGFQRLEPLNLADVAVDFEKAVTLSIEGPVEANISTSLPAVKALPTNAVGSNPEIASSAAAEVNPVAMELINQSATALVVRDELRQCVDDEKPVASLHMDIRFQVLKQGNLLGDVLEVQDTETLVGAIKTMLAPESFNPHEIRPVLGEAEPAIHLSSDIQLKLVRSSVMDSTVQEADATSDMNYEWAAISWSDQLRQSLGATPLDPGDIQVQLKGLQPSEQQLNGTASWYGPYFHGRRTANGETFNQNTLTAAHKSLPFNTVLQVRNLKNNRTVVVRINDRGPYIGKRSLDLSKAAARCLGSEKVGVIPYEAVILEAQPTEIPPME